MNRKLIMVMGFPGSGKTTYAKKLAAESDYFHINRDMFDEPGKIITSEAFHKEELSKLMYLKFDLVVDNTYPTVESRKLALDLAKEHKYDVECHHMTTSIEDTEFNVSKRMIERYGSLVKKDHSDATINDSNIFPASVLFNYQKKMVPPTKEEGFTEVKKIKFNRVLPEDFVNKALILDYDGTLRTTKSGDKFPTDPNDVEILPGRKEVLQKYKDKGYILLGVSNQSACTKGALMEQSIVACFGKTNDLLGINIDYKYCNHAAGPISCYCRKPMPGLGVEFIMKYKLDPKKCIMVGDMTSDETFAKRAGFRYKDANAFFK